MRDRVLRQVDAFYAEFAKPEPYVDVLVHFMRLQDRDNVREFFESLARTGKRWRFPQDRIEVVTVDRIRVVGPDAVVVEWCDVTNATKFYQHDWVKTYDDEIIEEGVVAAAQQDRWVKEEGEWRMTLDTYQQVYKGATECPK